MDGSLKQETELLIAIAREDLHLSQYDISKDNILNFKKTNSNRGLISSKMTLSRDEVYTKYE